jgi:transketolase
MSVTDHQQPESTREAYRDALVEAMGRDGRLVCLDSDTGLYSGTDFGAAEDRYVNLGIAEMTLMNTAAGLAASGLRPHANTFAAFAAARAVEAVKVGIAYPDLPVCIAATHSGLSAGRLGPTHHALEDLAVMRALPNMTVLVPADGAGTRAALDATLRIDGPVYLRLGRKATPAVSGDQASPVRLGRLQQLRQGDEVSLLACGSLPVLAALDAREALLPHGISAAVHNVHTLKPFDADGVLRATGSARLVVTVEEHWLAGGLGSAVAEVLSAAAPRPVLRLGVPDEFTGMAS